MFLDRGVIKGKDNVCGRVVGKKVRMFVVVLVCGKGKGGV